MRRRTARPGFDATGEPGGGSDTELPSFLNTG
jgi:hypothetical protein